MKKQTAVDLLVSILNKDGFTPVLTNEEIQHFKQMEKEQIVEAFENYLSYYDERGEVYYNETYGGQDE